MSEQDTTQETEVTPEEAEDQNPTAEQPESQEDDGDEAWDPERAKRKIGKVNSENRALRERATKAEQKAASVDDLTKENGGLKATVLQLEVGYELGLPLAIARRLQGATREEMLADAEALVELVAPTKRPPSQRPTEQLRGGGQPEREPEETDTRKIAARMFQH
ncbi:hypothetical protein [Nocardioides sp. REDSEA-S30_B4]|jgi:flagellar biosynthesis GTPase FlhF|uniref:hypothetical protein n=1 Tax=Nocardioides sp. REDSEA-S30_B4 TaxID=1811552 RepID=UPI000AD8F5E0|nr:hypothetical protein [Nocardioides sp. REDSEA-S30_B4]